VLLTDAELDHTLGLLLLREGRGLELHATETVRDTLYDGTSLLRTLEAYCPVQWLPVMLGVDVPLADGLWYRAFDVPTTKPARFGSGAGKGRVVGYRLTHERSSRTLVYLPSVQELTAVRDQLDDCACLLVDGTCWRDDELIRLGLADKTAREMGHLPIDGPDGSLALLAALPIGRTIYIHINNTNPILVEGSPERLHVERNGWEVAEDGMEIVL
jgi:pyrroloquinoline quinone biosynthesis protein B